MQALKTQPHRPPTAPSAPQAWEGFRLQEVPGEPLGGGSWSAASRMSQDPPGFSESPHVTDVVAELCCPGSSEWRGEGTPRLLGERRAGPDRHHLRLWNSSGSPLSAEQGLRAGGAGTVGRGAWEDWPAVARRDAAAAWGPSSGTCMWAGRQPLAVLLLPCWAVHSVSHRPAQSAGTALPPLLALHRGGACPALVSPRACAVSRLPRSFHGGAGARAGHQEPTVGQTGGRGAVRMLLGLEAASWEGPRPMR